MSMISIIIPCYNVEKYIRRCVDSLFKQTIGIDNLQLIFVDDASTDNTLSLLYEIEKEYPENIIVVACEENGRQGRARNIGLQYAEADYIGFVDSDDRIDKTMYEKLYEKAIQYDCDIVSCNYVIVYDENSCIETCKDKDQLININNLDDKKRLMHKGIGKGGIWSKIYKKQLIFDNQINFPEKLAYEDNFFGFLVILFANKIYYVNENLYHYFFNCNSTTTSRNAKYHFDRLIIEQMIIDYCKNNGFFDKYKSELEYRFIHGFYINTLHIIFTRFDKMPVDMIKMMREKLKSMFPLYENNKYIGELTETNRALLSTAKKELKEKDLDEIAYRYREVVELLYEVG